MTTYDGMRISLTDESRLDSSGILLGSSGCSRAYGLSDEAVRLFLLIAAAGPGGLPKTRIPSDLKTDLALHLVPLELQALVAWERDPRGRLAYLVLTWKGEEALAAAKPVPLDPSKAWAARRRALNGGG